MVKSKSVVYVRKRNLPPQFGVTGVNSLFTTVIDPDAPFAHNSFQ